MATKRKKGESPKSYASRPSQGRGTKKVDPDAGRFPGQGIVEGLLAGLAFVPAVAIAAVAAEEISEAERRRAQREAERELERVERERERLLRRMSSNYLFETRDRSEEIRTKYLVDRLEQINRQLIGEPVYSTRRFYLEQEKRKLENELLG